MKILVVEDEEHLAAGLRFNLEAEGFEAVTVESGEEALELLKGPNGYGMVILDVMLPGKDGFEVARELRASNIYVPILMLTARGRAEDILKGLDAGADDYLPKPFDLSILLARLRGLLRRSRWEAQEPPAAEKFEFAGRVIDFENQTLEVGDKRQPLTLLETNLLRYLSKNEGRAVSRKALLEQVWGVREDTDTRAVDNFIVRLRRYIEDEPSEPRHLLTVRGVGYRFIAEPDSAADA